MKRLINFLRGTAVLLVQGPFLERYFNICAAAGLGFWGSRPRSDQAMEITVSYRDRKRAMALGEKALCQVTLIRVEGLPAQLPRFRRRQGMVIGLLLVAGLFGVLSRFVLVIEVEGNVQVSQSTILAQLQRQGFGIGTYGPSVDVRDLSNRVLLEMEELSFLTVNLSGIRAQVIVREAEPAPEILDRSQPADVVARRDGVVVRVDCQGGRQVVQPGQAVLEGEVLLSGLLINERGDGSGEVVSTKQIMARGEVWALTRHTLQATTPLQALCPGEAAWETGYGLTILGRRFNFYGTSSNEDTECDKMSILYPLTLPDGQQLPFGLWKTQWRPWAPAKVDGEGAELFLRRCLTQRLETLLGEGGQVMGTHWQTEQSEGAVTVTVEAQCLEQIGETILLE